jgi:hypothetical protein
MWRVSGCRPRRDGPELGGRSGIFVRWDFRSGVADCYICGMYTDTGTSGPGSDAQSRGDEDLLTRMDAITLWLKVCALLLTTLVLELGYRLSQAPH